MSRLKPRPPGLRDAAQTVTAVTELISEYEDAASNTYNPGTTPGQAGSDSTGTLLYQHGDHLTTRITTENNGDLSNRQGHYPYDESWYETGTANPSVSRKYTTYLKEDETASGKLNYAVFRQHSARTGRFLMADPVRGRVRIPQRLNRYAYVLNNPSNFRDPKGLDEWGGPYPVWLTLEAPSAGPSYGMGSFVQIGGPIAAPGYWWGTWVEGPGVSAGWLGGGGWGSDWLGGGGGGGGGGGSGLDLNGPLPPAQREDCEGNYNRCKDLANSRFWQCTWILNSVTALGMAPGLIGCMMSGPLAIGCIAVVEAVELTVMAINTAACASQRFSDISGCERARERCYLRQPG